MTDKKLIDNEDLNMVAGGELAELPKRLHDITAALEWVNYIYMQNRHSFTIDKIVHQIFLSEVGSDDEKIEEAKRWVTSGSYSRITESDVYYFLEVLDEKIKVTK